MATSSRSYALSLEQGSSALISKLINWLQPIPTPRNFPFQRIKHSSKMGALVRCRVPLYELDDILNARQERRRVICVFQVAAAALSQQFRSATEQAAVGGDGASLVVFAFLPAGFDVAFFIGPFAALLVSSSTSAFVTTMNSVLDLSFAVARPFSMIVVSRPEEKHR
jgi:hypothetical protein